MFSMHGQAKEKQRFRLQDLLEAKVPWALIHLHIFYPLTPLK